MTDFVAVVDGGASRTRCALLTRFGEQIGYAESGASNYYGSNLDGTSQALSAAITQALKQAGLTAGDAACIIAGLASVGAEGEDAMEPDRVLELLGFSRRMVVGDMVIAHVGALNRQPGVMVVAGTGSSCIGITSDGRRVKIGGWGPAYGDEGSGYYIGRMALHAAARAYDGYGPPTRLVESIAQALRISDFRESLDCVYRRQFSARQMAGLAESTQRTAAEGDAVAASILATAGADLATMAVSMLQRLFPDDPSPLVSYAGGLLVSCEAIRKPFTDNILDAVPNAQVIPPRYPPYLGAFLLACSMIGWSWG